MPRLTSFVLLERKIRQKKFQEGVCHPSPCSKSQPMGQLGTHVLYTSRRSRLWESCHKTLSSKRQLLVQDFSTGALGPPWCPRSGFPGATNKRLYQIGLPWYCKTQRKIRIFVFEIMFFFTTTSGRPEAAYTLRHVERINSRRIVNKRL